MADRGGWWRAVRSVVLEYCVGAVVVACLGVGVWLLAPACLKAQPQQLPPRPVDLEVVQAARAYCEQQLANILEQARALQKEVDELKQQQAAKETLHE